MKLRNSPFAGILFFIAYPFLAFSQSDYIAELTDLKVDSCLVINTDEYLQKATELAITLNTAQFLPLDFFTAQRAKMYEPYGLFDFKLIPGEKNILWSENDQTQLNLKTGEVSHIVSKQKPQYPWDSFEQFSNFTLPATSDPRWDSIQLSRGHYFYSDEYLWIIKGGDTLRVILHQESLFSHNFPFFWVTYECWDPISEPLFQRIRCYDAAQHKVLTYNFRIPRKDGNFGDFSKYGVHDLNTIWFCDAQEGIWGFDKNDRHIYYYPLNSPEIKEWEFLGVDHTYLYFAYREFFLVVNKRWLESTRKQITAEINK